MTQHRHQTAPTQFVEAAGVRFAYRRFGKRGGAPLLFNIHFTGTMDHWDPLVTDGLAATREVVLFNNAGVSSTSGEVPTSMEEMASNAVAFVRALGLEAVDVLGFSIGGFVSQAMALADLLAWFAALSWWGRGPGGGERMASPGRRRLRRYSARPTRTRMRCGCTPSSRRPRRARLLVGPS